MGKEVHIYAPAYRDDEFDEILETCEHIVFNSVEQYKKFKNRVKNHPKDIECGLRINPEYSEVETELYDPCAIGSRLGTVAGNSVRRTLRGSMDCIFIRCVNRMLTRWSAHLRLSRRSSGSIFTR